ncbi:hypothetical protein JCM33374_g4141 [Metschnikowia sp. JCM 33374]|nr:hypothetical protein JCM33374_g4141 [Metschnikowia sp. JCM 33374]
MPNQCEYFLERKNRRCAMQRKKGQHFCSEHSVFESNPKENGSIEPNPKEARIPCPLDPKHSVKLRDLEMHLKKCNARPVEIHQPWYAKDINAQLNGTIKKETKKKLNEKESLSSDEEVDVLKRLFAVLEDYNRKVDPLEKKVQIHEGLDNWSLKKENKKHVAQQSSLIAAMKEANLLSSETFYVEFGCGKAELSRMVNACVVHDFKQSINQDNTHQNYGYGLIDRGVNRMKMDNKIVADCEGTPIQPQIKRSRIDIQHLDLDKFMEPMNYTSIVAISKHLCGAATDLTLKSLLNSTKSQECLDGVVVAMCCRHVCDYDQLLPASQDFLAEYDIADSAMFSSLKKIVTWAVCGKREGQEDNHITGLSYEQRERLGLIARRLIDESRVVAINSLLKDHRAELFLYAEKETTLENHCLRITRRG